MAHKSKSQRQREIMAYNRKLEAMTPAEREAFLAQEEAEREAKAAAMDPERKAELARISAGVALAEKIARDTDSHQRAAAAACGQTLEAWKKDGQADRDYESEAEDFGDYNSEPAPNR